MITTLCREWTIKVPEEIIRKLGICEECGFECRVHEGELCLQPIDFLKRGVNSLQIIIQRYAQIQTYVIQMTAK